MFEAVVWVAGGAFVGWIFSLSEFRAKRTAKNDIAAGVIGGFLGGLLTWVLGSDTTGWNSLSIFVSVVSATSLIAVVRFLKK